MQKSKQELLEKSMEEIMKKLPADAIIIEWIEEIDEDELEKEQYKNNKKDESYRNDNNGDDEDEDYNNDDEEYEEYKHRFDESDEDENYDYDYDNEDDDFKNNEWLEEDDEDYLNLENDINKSDKKKKNKKTSKNEPLEIKKYTYPWVQNDLILDESKGIYYMKNENEKYLFIDNLVERIKNKEEEKLENLFNFIVSDISTIFNDKLTGFWWEERNLKIVDMFYKRWKEIKNIRTKNHLTEACTDNEAVLEKTKYKVYTEIDFHLFAMIKNYITYETWAIFPWILRIEPNSTIVKLFAEWEINSNILKLVREKLKLTKTIKQFDLKENKFIKNIFNQMQMLTNIKKTVIFDFNGNQIDKASYASFIQWLPENINLFIYNMSFNEGRTFLRDIYNKDLTTIYPKLKPLYEHAKSWEFMVNKKFMRKVMYIDFDEKTNQLTMVMPFWVNSNVGSFFECFRCSIKREALLKQYYKINWFKIIFSDKGKELVVENNYKEIKEIFSQDGEYETYFIDIAQ